MTRLLLTVPEAAEALAISRKVLGEEHPQTATSLNNLGSLLDAIGDHAAARSSYEQALAISRKALGEEHPRTAVQLVDVELSFVIRRRHDVVRRLTQDLRRTRVGFQAPQRCAAHRTARAIEHAPAEHDAVCERDVTEVLGRGRDHDQGVVGRVSLVAHGEVRQFRRKLAEAGQDCSSRDQG